MGQKVSPIGMRIGINRDWDAIWYANNTQVADLLQEDLKIRKFIEKTYAKAQVSRVIIERVKSQNKSRIKISVFTARPGIVIGHDAETKNEVIKKLQYLTKKDIILNVIEIKKAELDATLVARSIAEQLENRASFRRVQKVAIQRALKAGAKGAKTLISGRLGGAEMARSEGYNEGRVPLQTLRADVDYAVAEATTTYGKLGIKVWIYKGELFEIPARVQEPRRKPAPKDGQKPVDGKAAKPRTPRTPKAQADKGGNE